MGSYDQERKPPTVGFCGPSTKIIQLFFNGKTLRMSVYDSPTATCGPDMKTSEYTYAAVSGRKVNGRFDYSKERQKIPNEGPIPAGNYWINPSETWENAWYKLNSPDSAWGNYRITLHPYPGTKHQGRGGFFIHGGDTPGSAGCIDLTTKMDQFIKDFRAELNGDSQCRVDVTVAY